MRIGIDMRMAGTGEGIGRYVEELARHLATIDHENDYVLIFQSESASLQFTVNSANFRKVVLASKYYSWAEQTRFIWELKKLKLDLMHFTNFNYPVLYQGKFVVTIHDLIHHQFPGKKKSRFLHRAAYRFTIRSAIKKAEKVIAVSEATRQDIVRSFKVNPEKISVVYEGVDARFFNMVPSAQINEIKQKYGITGPYLLFVGVWRQYKNLPALASAFDILKLEQSLSHELVLAGKIDPFYPEIKNIVFKAKFARDIKALGFVPDGDLPALYQGASAFVLPSLTEGFGLIVAEAQASRVPAILSDIPVLREVAGDGAIFFDPHDHADMARKMNMGIADNSLRDELINKGLENAKRFIWQEAARQTLQIYKNAGKRN